MTHACFTLPTVGINVDTRAQVRLTSTANVILAISFSGWYACLTSANV